MKYSVMLNVIDEPGFEGYYYAHIPTLDLTTHGKGIDGALAAAKELAEVWIAEKRARAGGERCSKNMSKSCSLPM